MIDSPGVIIRIRTARRWTVSGKYQMRTREFAEQVLRFYHHRHADCEIEVVQAAAEHVGLGTGTQLALSIASGLSAFFGYPEIELGQLAKLTGRGQRSAVGSRGFQDGGLIVDEGKIAEDSCLSAADRFCLPDSWRWLLVRPRGAQGLSGSREQQAFSQLPAVLDGVRSELVDEVQQRLIPAARNGEFEGFGESLYRYGVRAGMCFASQQDGGFATRELAERVARFRQAGVAGVGQSSWGPTLFAIFASEAQAVAFRDRAGCWPDGDNLVWTLAAPNNTGVAISVREARMLAE
jgi:beta-RFAP synthase